MNMQKQKGFAPIAIILIIIGVLAVAGGIWYWQKSKAPEQKACTEEAKICPDGSYVSRTGPNCEFAACPETKTDETANWQTYRNDEYGFEVKYPSDWEASGCAIAEPPALKYCVIRNSSRVNNSLWEEAGYLGSINITVLESSASAYESVKKPPSAEITPGTLTEKNISVGSQLVTEYSYLI
ncbi:MAG: hypothetical protein V1877_00515, partial [Candidatus Tagabacteria bacterium]